MRGRLGPPMQTEQIQTYATKSTSKQAFEKLCPSEKARQAVAKEGPNVMAVWGTPDDCIEKIKFYVDAIMRRRSDAGAAANLKTARISHRRFKLLFFFQLFHRVIEITHLDKFKDIRHRDFGAGLFVVDVDVVFHAFDIRLAVVGPNAVLRVVFPTF